MRVDTKMRMVHNLSNLGAWNIHNAGWWDARDNEYTFSSLIQTKSVQHMSGVCLDPQTHKWQTQCYTHHLFDNTFSYCYDSYTLDHYIRKKEQEKFLLKSIEKQSTWTVHDFGQLELPSLFYIRPYTLLSAAIWLRLKCTLNHVLQMRVPADGTKLVTKADFCMGKKRALLYDKRMSHAFFYFHVLSSASMMCLDQRCNFNLKLDPKTLLQLVSFRMFEWLLNIIMLGGHDLWKKTCVYESSTSLKKSLYPKSLIVWQTCTCMCRCKTSTQVVAVWQA